MAAESSAAGDYT